MGRFDRHDFEKMSRHFNIKIIEAAEVCFSFSGRNRHAYNRMFLVTHAENDDCYIHCHDNGQHFPLRTGNIYFMPCNADLEFNFNPDVCFLSFHFYLELFGSFDAFSLQKECQCIADHNYYIANLAEVIHEEYSLASQYRVNGLVMALAADFLKTSDKQVNQLYLITQKYAGLLDYISNDADASTTVEDLAQIAGMSRDKLSREFPRDCGITLKGYLTQTLIRRMEQMLLAPEASSRKVAEELNFNNEYYFCRFFKKHTGRTPTEFRKMETPYFV